MKEIFPTRLRALRIRIGKTQEEMAKTLEIKRSTYGEYERGKIVPSLDKIEQISKILKVTPNYLLGLDSNINVRNMARIFNVDPYHTKGKMITNMAYYDKSRILNRVKIWNDAIGKTVFTDEEFNELMLFVRYLLHKREL